MTYTLCLHTNILPIAVDATTSHGTSTCWVRAKSCSRFLPSASTQRSPVSSASLAANNNQQ